MSGVAVFCALFPQVMPTVYFIIFVDRVLPFENMVFRRVERTSQGSNCNASVRVWAERGSESRQIPNRLEQGLISVTESVETLAVKNIQRESTRCESTDLFSAMPNCGAGTGREVG